MCREVLRHEVRQQPDSKLNTLEHTRRIERRLSLRKKIEAFRQLQLDHMPGVQRLLEEYSNLDDQDHEAEDIPLFMPSDLAAAVRSLICDAKLIAVEDELREAQTSESLDDLRRALRARTFANKFKIKNVTGQRANTRAHEWQKTIDNQALTSKYRYRRARKALLALRGHGAWEATLKELKDEDVRAFNERALTEVERLERVEARRVAGFTEEQIEAETIDNSGLQLGEGRRAIHISWIWYSAGTAGLRSAATSEAEVHEGTCCFIVSVLFGC